MQTVQNICVVTELSTFIGVVFIINGTRINIFIQNCQLIVNYINEIDIK